MLQLQVYLSRHSVDMMRRSWCVVKYTSTFSGTTNSTHDFHSSICIMLASCPIGSRKIIVFVALWNKTHFHRVFCTHWPLHAMFFRRTRNNILRRHNWKRKRYRITSQYDTFEKSFTQIMADAIEVCANRLIPIRSASLCKDSLNTLSFFTNRLNDASNMRSELSN